MVAEEWAGPVTEFLAFCNTDTARKTASVRPALEVAGIKITAVGIRGSIPPASPIL